MGSVADVCSVLAGGFATEMRQESVLQAVQWSRIKSGSVMNKPRNGVDGVRVTISDNNFFPCKAKMVRLSWFTSHYDSPDMAVEMCTQEEEPTVKLCGTCKPFKRRRTSREWIMTLHIERDTSILFQWLLVFILHCRRRCSLHCTSGSLYIPTNLWLFVSEVSSR